VLTNYPERLDANDVFCGFLFLKRKINFLSFFLSLTTPSLVLETH